MNDKENRPDVHDAQLKGTTFRVYRHILKKGPIGTYAVQKALGLSSPSVAQYHIKKLIELGLVREEGGGYLVDKIVLDNIVRIGNLTIPSQTASVAFFCASLFILLLLLRPAVVTSLYFFALVIDFVALASSIYGMITTLKRFRR